MMLTIETVKITFYLLDNRGVVKGTVGMFTNLPHKGILDLTAGVKIMALERMCLDYSRLRGYKASYTRIKTIEPYKGTYTETPA